MRNKNRNIQARRSPRKISPPILNPKDDEANEREKTAIETYRDETESCEMEEDLNLPAGNNGGFTIDSDSLGFRVCVRCNVRDELILICCETGCLIAVHESCMRCDPSFDNSGRFLCPVCKQKRASEQVEKARKKVMEAKRALSIFLECGNKEDRNVQAQPEVSHENDVSATENQVEREEKLESEILVDRPKRFKQKAGKTKSVGVRSSPRMKMTFTKRKGIARKNASGSSVHKKSSLYSVDNFLSEKRKRLHWTSKEEEMLREGVGQISGTNKNISWRGILEQGHHVFHSTRTPVDLRDKWRTMMAREGSVDKSI